MGPGAAARRAEIVREAVEALNAGEWERALAHLSADFEYDLTRTISPLRGVYSREQMRGVVEEFLGPWESATYEPDEVIEAGERIVMPFTTRFRGRDGIEVASRATWVWSFDGESRRAARPLPGPRRGARRGGGLRVLQAFWDGGGNTAPQLGIARALVGRGHEVVFLGNECQREKVEASGAAFRPYRHAPANDASSPETDLLRDWEAKTPLGRVRPRARPADVWARRALCPRRPRGARGRAGRCRRLGHDADGGRNGAGERRRALGGARAHRLPGADPGAAAVRARVRAGAGTARARFATPRSGRRSPASSGPA